MFSRFVQRGQHFSAPMVSTSNWLNERYSAYLLERSTTAKMFRKLPFSHLHDSKSSMVRSDVRSTCSISNIGIL